jgi:hypothetical protein
VSVIVAVVGLLGVVVLYALTRFLLIALLSAALLLLAGFMARATLRALARPVGEFEAAPPASPFIIMNPRSGGGKVARFGLVERAEALSARVVLLDGCHHVDVVALAREAVTSGRTFSASPAVTEPRRWLRESRPTMAFRFWSSRPALVTTTSPPTP